MYINRTMERQILKSSKNYPVIMVCGQRQVGKSTMLNHIKETNRRYVSLDDRNARRLAHEDPDLFFETYYCGEKSKEIEIFASVKNYKHLIDLLKRIIENDNIEEIYLQYGIDISEKKDNLPIRFLIKKND